MDRQLVIMSNGATWGVVLSELTVIEVLKIAEQLADALNRGMDVFKSPEVVTAEFAKREVQKALDAANDEFEKKLKAAKDEGAEAALDTARMEADEDQDQEA